MTRRRRAECSIATSRIKGRLAVPIPAVPAVVDPEALTLRPVRKTGFPTRLRCGAVRTELGFTGDIVRLRIDRDKVIINVEGKRQPDCIRAADGADQS